MRVCFFANLRQHANRKELFERIDFYKIDLQLLRELGHSVHEASAPSEIDWGADLYYGWWWGHAPFITFPAKLRRKPMIVTGAFDYATCRAELPGLCYLDRPRWQRVVLAAMLRVADVNLFISQYEFEEVTANLKVRRPIALPLAINTATCVPDMSVGRSNYFFSVSLQSRTNAIRKGLDQTIKAFARIADEFPSTRLVLAGKPGDYTGALMELAKRRGVGGRVTFPGMISEAEKLRAYRECIAYVQPTLYEGFGHAVGEALACGAHVVSAARGAVPEVAGPYAECVDPHDTAAIASAMARAVASPNTPEQQMARHKWIDDNFSISRRREHLDAVIRSVV